MSENAFRQPFFKNEVLSRILKIAWPAILEQIMVMMGGIVVTMFLGRYGTQELAAAGLVNMIIVVLQTAFAGLATGSTVVIARITGEKQPREARSALFQSLILAGGLSVIITGLTWLAGDPLLSFFFRDVDPEVEQLAAIYFNFMMISMPFLSVDMTISASMRGAGDTMTPMLITGLGSVTNIVLCLLLVGRLGITGAGIALLTSRVVSSVLRIVFMLAYRRRLYLSFHEGYRLDLALISRIFRQGMPAFFEQAIMQGGFLMLNTMTTCVGQALGMRKPDEASAYQREALRTAVIVITSIGILAAVFARPLAGLYTTDPQVLVISVLLIWFFACTEPLLGVMNVSAAVLRAGGDIMYVTLTALIGLWLFRIGISSLLVYVFDLGIYGVMIGTGLDFLVRATLYYLRVRKGRWKERIV